MASNPGFMTLSLKHFDLPRIWLMKPEHKETMKMGHRYSTPPLFTIPSKGWLFSWGGKYIRTVLLEVALEWPFLLPAPFKLACAWMLSLKQTWRAALCLGTILWYDQRATTPLHLKLLQRIKINLEDSPASHPHSESSFSAHKVLRQPHGPWES